MTDYGTVFGGVFGGRADFDGKDPVYVDDTIRSGQLRLAGLIWIALILVGLSYFMDLVPGYAVGGGAAGVTWSALPHSVWMIANLFSLWFAGQAIYLGTDTDIAGMLVSLTVAVWFIVIACILNLVQLVAVCFEVNNVNSTFWLQNGGAWVWVLLFGLIVFILWDVLVAWHLFVYRSNVEIAHYQYGWMPSGVKAGSLASVQQPQQQASTSADATDTTTLVAAQSRIGAKFLPWGAPRGKDNKDL